jgi:hypothetical protein
MALQTQRNEGVKIFEANAWRMVSNATTSKETSADHTTRIKHPQETTRLTPRPAGRPQQTIRQASISTLKKLGFEEKKGQLREWMTIARDRPAWALKVEYKLDLPPGSFTNLHRQ